VGRCEFKVLSRAPGRFSTELWRFKDSNAPIKDVLAKFCEFKGG
jgi:hypothetical protein